VSKLPKTAFQKGCAPGPGRPPGKRNYLTEIALQALGEDFEQHGKAAIEKVRREKTHIYLQIIASLLPRQLHVERTSPLGDLTDEELQLLEEHVAAVRARLVEKIEQHNGAQSFPPASPKTSDVK
jgi:hypothetical protein